MDFLNQGTCICVLHVLEFTIRLLRLFTQKPLLESFCFEVACLVRNRSFNGRIIGRDGESIMITYVMYAGRQCLRVSTNKPGSENLTFISGVDDTCFVNFIPCDFREAFRRCIHSMTEDRLYKNDFRFIYCLSNAINMEVKVAETGSFISISETNGRSIMIGVTCLNQIRQDMNNVVNDFDKLLRENKYVQ